MLKLEHMHAAAPRVRLGERKQIRNDAVNKIQYAVDLFSRVSHHSFQLTR